MKKLFFLLFLAALTLPASAQQHDGKLSSDEAARMTPDQRLQYQTNRKSKKKKGKQVSTKQKVKIQRKTENKMRRKKDPKKKKGSQRRR